MPLLSYEGVEVDLPANLAGIQFEFTAGSLTIHCRDFTGDVVLSKPTGQDSRGKASSPSKKRTIDLKEADAKRQRPNFLNEAEQSLLLAQLNGPRSASKVKTDAEEEKTATEQTNTGKKKTPTKKSKKKANNVKEGVGAFFSPEPKHRQADKTPKSSSGKSIKDLMSGPPKHKRAAAVKWGMVEALGNAPPERWGHTATKISDERVVVYGGTDDDERTLGDLHVFDMKTHRWTTPLNCETITRTWHDAVYLSSKNLVLVFGGERNAATEGELDILSDIMVLDTECFLWYPPAIRGSPPSARSGHTCTAVGNEVVVFNDWNWKAVKVEGKPPSARTYHSAVAVGDDKIVYFGGNDSSKSFNAVHVLQKVEKKASGAVWTWFHPCVVGVPPQERTGHSATLLNDGKILIFGGWDPQRDDANAPTSVFSDVFLLDTQTWEWQPATYADDGTADTALRGRVGHGAVLDCNGNVHIFGGQNGVEQRLKDICTLTISQKEEDNSKGLASNSGATTVRTIETV
ncbi:Kelch-type beta propeller [Phytophthora cactorum]|nr:Kelch-type beta propeller [Phytophthora cactorum]